MILKKAPRPVAEPPTRPPPPQKDFCFKKISNGSYPKT